MLRCYSAALLVCLAASGCSSIRLPLCPKVAAVSFPVGTKISPVNWYVAEAAEQSGIKLTQLSPFVAEFRGTISSLRSFESNYRFLVCAFDPVQESDPRASFMTCVAHVPFWIEAVKSETPQNLMLQEHLYFERCVR